MLYSARVSRGVGMHLKTAVMCSRQPLPNANLRAHIRVRYLASSLPMRSATEHKVVLDNETLYIGQDLAEALGWKPEKGSDAGIHLSLSGWSPRYFTITPAGTDSGEY